MACVKNDHKVSIIGHGDWRGALHISNLRISERSINGLVIFWDFWHLSYLR